MKSPAMLARREREKETHRREIVEAAERVFAEKGFDHATVEDVAREAQFSIGAIYTFFANKEVLWAEVIEKIARDFLEDFREEKARVTDPHGAVLALIRLRLSHADAHAPFLRAFMEAKPGSRVIQAAALPKSSQELYDTYISEAADLFQAAMAAGRLTPGDPVYTALSLEGIIFAFRGYWARQRKTLTIPEQVALVRRHFMVPLEASEKKE